MSDTLLRFFFAGAPVRGGAVRLEGAWRRMIEHHGYPPAVARLLGEATAAAALLTSSIKFNGALILQLHGDGPVRLLVVECQPDLRLRATAKLDGAAAIPPETADLQTLVNAHGRGRCAITLDPLDRLPGQQPYQGVVPLEGESIAQALQTYLKRSEQTDSRLWLAADADCAAGLLLQRLPEDGGAAGKHAPDPDAWPRAVALAQTLTPAELLREPPQTILRRLFWQQPPHVTAPRTPSFGCNCSRERIGRMLLSLGKEEIDGIVAERGQVEVTCDFCNATRIYDAVDAAQLFATGIAAGPEDPAGAAISH
jgi:molecular chaperone Hsp33